MTGYIPGRIDPRDIGLLFLIGVNMGKGLHVKLDPEGGGQFKGAFCPQFDKDPFHGHVPVILEQDPGHRVLADNLLDPVVFQHRHRAGHEFVPQFLGHRQLPGYQKNLRGVAGHGQGAVHRGALVADNGHRDVAIEVGVAVHAVADPAAAQLFLPRHFQFFPRGAGGKDNRSGRDLPPRLHCDLELFIGRLDIKDILVPDLGPEPPYLLQTDLQQLLAFLDPFDAEIVLHVGPIEAALLQPSEDQDRDPFPDRMQSGLEAGRAGADYHNIIDIHYACSL